MIFKHFFLLLTIMFDITSSRLSGKPSIIVNFRQLIDDLNLVESKSENK